METVFDVPLEVRFAPPAIVRRRLALEPPRAACPLTARISSSATFRRRRRGPRRVATPDRRLDPAYRPNSASPPRAQTFLRVVYGDDGFFFRRFHAETGECEDAVVPPWEPITGSRVVRFSKRMTMPNPIEKLLGASAADVIAGAPRFEETQWIKYDPARGVASVRSLPSLVNSFGKDRFVTEVHVTYSAVRDDRDVERCAMVAKLTVSAAGTWGLQHAVEKLMEHRAKSSFREWARWTDDFLSEHYAGDNRRDAPLPRLAPFFGGEDRDRHDDASEGVNGEPRTPARPRRADAFGDGLEGDSLEVDTPPRDRDTPGTGGERTGGERTGGERTGGERTGERGADAAAADDDAFYADADEHRGGESTDDDFDDARSFHSTASFVSAKSAATSEKAATSVAARPSTRGETDADADADAAKDSVPVASTSAKNAATDESEVSSPSRAPPTSPWRRLMSMTSSSRGEITPASSAPKSARAATNGTATNTNTNTSAPAPPSRSPRADDVFRDGWFMQTVMKDLGALRASAEDQRATCASLEENVAALRAESAALRAELRRYVSRGGAADLTAHRGDFSARDGAGGWIAWTAVVATAAAAGYLAATVARKER